MAKLKINLILLFLFSISFSSIAQEVFCGDGIDNDGDGLIDCEDPDCDLIPLPSADSLNTGSNGSGGLLSGGSNDLSWTYSTTLNGAYFIAIVMNSPPSNYYVPATNATWISTPTGQHSSNLTLFFKTSFFLPCEGNCGRSISDSGAYCLEMDFLADNSVVDIFVNGISQAASIPAVPPVGVNTNTHTGFQFVNRANALMCSGWKSGLNEIIIEVRSGPPFIGFLGEFSSSTLSSSINPPPTYINNALCYYVHNGDTIHNSGTYYDTIALNSSCDSINTLIINIDSINSTIIYDTICAGETYNFNGNTLINSGVYFDTIKNYNCYNITQLNLFVKNPDDCFILIPNSFSPNKDGDNELFLPIGSGESLNNFEMTIYNRWGQVMYVTNEILKGWNGKTNNKNCSEGVYYYIVTYSDSKQNEKSQNGAFHLFR